MQNILFSTEDLKSPDRLERVLRQFQSAMQELASTGIAAPSKSAALSPANDIVSLSKAVRDQLQATGAAPLNLQSLLPSVGTGQFIEDTHAARLTSYPAGNYQAGVSFLEADRNVLYTIVLVGGVQTWIYTAGTMVGLFAAKPVDLGTADTGFEYFATDTPALYVWNGTTFVIAAPDTGITQLTGDVTAGPGSGSQVATIANKAVTYAKMQDATAEAVICRASSSNGVLGEITLTASQLLGRGSTGDVAALTLGTNLSMSGTTLNATGGGGGGDVQYVEAKRTAGDVTTTSTSFVDLTGMSVTITTGAHRCFIDCKIVGFNSASAAINEYDVLIDGVSQGGSLGMMFVTTVTGGSTNVNFSFSFTSSVLSASSHTIKIQWKVNGGTGTTYASSTTACILGVTEKGF